MSKQKKVWLTIITFLPLALYIPFLYSMVSYIGNMNTLEQSGVEPTPKEVFELSSGFMIWGLVLTAFAIVLLIYYGRHIFRNKNIGGTERMIWIAVVFIGSFVGQIIYLFTRIWPINEPQKPKKEEKLYNTL